MWHGCHGQDERQVQKEVPQRSDVDFAGKELSAITQRLQPLMQRIDVKNEKRERKRAGTSFR